MTTTLVHDVIHANLRSAPSGLLAGYTTGSPDIRWTAADWAAHPGAVRIDQDSGAVDSTADVLDVESGAASASDVPGWVRRALASFNLGTRPGQRQPAIYMSAYATGAVTSALASAGIAPSQASLWIANWNLSLSQAIALVDTAVGGYPVIGVQYANAGAYDLDVFSTAWLNDPSGPVYHLSVTPHVTLDVSFAAVPGADHYVITWTPAHGQPVTLRPPQPASGPVRVTSWEVPAGPGSLTVNAIVKGKPLLVHGVTVKAAEHVSASWDKVPGADHYVATFHPAHGADVTVRPPQPSGAVVRVTALEVPVSPGTFSASAIVKGKPVSVGTLSLP